MQTNKIFHKTVHTKNINDSVGELPAIKLSIRDEQRKEEPIDPTKEYLDLRKSKLNENYTQDQSSATSQTARYLLNGGDYHSELDSLHKNITPYVVDSAKSNAQDNYIHDVLKRGKPSGETVAHIHDILHSTDTGQYNSYTERYHNTGYLQDKWEPFLDAHAKEKQSIFKKEDATYTKDEINKIPSTFDVKGLRLLKHTSSGHFYEMHPTEGLKYVGNRFRSTFSSKDTQHDDHVLNNKLTSETDTNANTKNDIHEYTEDSAPVNRYLHHEYSGKNNIKNPRIEEKIAGISKHFETVAPLPHLQDFHVYTGVYAELNPRTQSTHRDEHGNYLFHNPSFTSTSIDDHTAETFAKHKTDDAYTFDDNPDIHHSISDVMKIRIPSGYPHGSYVKPHSAHESENEFLLDKGHTFVLNPNPTHYATNGKIVRMWHAELHPKNVDTSKAFENKTRNQKIDTLMHPDVKSEDIEKAAKDEDFSVRSMAAKHPRVHPETLKTLANDDSPKVRISAMMNEHTPDHLMETSIDDYSSALGIARRKKVSDHLMDKLINHDFVSVGVEVASRPDLTTDHIIKLVSTEDPKHKIKASLAANPHLDPEVYHALHTHNSDDVRLNLAKNPSLRKDTAEALMRDHSYPVASAARSTHTKQTSMN